MPEAKTDGDEPGRRAKRRKREPGGVCAIERFGGGISSEKKPGTVLQRLSGLGAGEGSRKGVCAIWRIAAETL